MANETTGAAAFYLSSLTSARNAVRTFNNKVNGPKAVELNEQQAYAATKTMADIAHEALSALLDAGVEVPEALMQQLNLLAR